MWVTKADLPQIYRHQPKLGLIMDAIKNAGYKAGPMW